MQEESWRSSRVLGLSHTPIRPDSQRYQGQTFIGRDRSGSVSVSSFFFLLTADSKRVQCSRTMHIVSIIVYIVYSDN